MKTTIKLPNGNQKIFESYETNGRVFVDEYDSNYEIVQSYQLASGTEFNFHKSLSKHGKVVE